MAATRAELEIRKRLCILYDAKDKATALGWTETATFIQEEITKLEGRLPS